jgi:hypothetical protein
MLNNQNNGRQFNFLTDPVKSAAYEIEIGATNGDPTIWTEVEIPVILEPTMYMIGSQFGNWEWSSDEVVEMTPVYDNPGHFWAVRYIIAGEAFKWFPGRGWDNGFNTLGTELGYVLVGGDAAVAADGMYMIYVDMENSQISLEPAKVYGIGNAFGNWDQATHVFTVENQTMVITTTKDSDELRIYARSDIDPVGGDWWKMEFILRAGVIEYRGNGGDQHPRVAVSAGQKITLDFNAGTGTIQ